MPYDLLIKNGTIVDGSGAPAFRGDVAVRDGRIVEVGKASGGASRVIDAEGLVVAPGFIDNHCHYDAQATWDPLCTSSCYHGATSVIIGNCSLALAPVRPEHHEQVLGMLSFVEAIPMDVLRRVDWRWESVGEYMAHLDQRMGVNLGVLVGHSALRYYVMGAESQQRYATEREVEEQRRILSEALEAGALGFSVSQSQGHFDPQGRRIPAAHASLDEIRSLASVICEHGAGALQVSGCKDQEMKQGFCTELSRLSGTPVVYNAIVHHALEPEEWRQHLAIVEERCRNGSRAYPMCSPLKTTDRFTMKNCQVFRGLPTWKPILMAPDDQKLRAYRDPELRRRLYEEAVERKRVDFGRAFSGRWDLMTVARPALPKNTALKGKTIEQLAREQGKNVVDALLDLAVEEGLETGFEFSQINSDPEAVATFVRSPYVVVGLSDGGAHVVFENRSGYSTTLLGKYVRDEGILTLEEAVRKLTSHSAQVFGIADRGLLRPGLAADIVLFDLATIGADEPRLVRDFPAGGSRLVQTARGVTHTIVNGRVLIEDNKPTGETPGRVLRNARYLRQ